MKSSDTYAVRRERAEVVGSQALKKDPQSVTPEGRALASPIQGVRERTLITHLDERGSLCEIFNPAWSFDDEPLAYVYQASILPGYVKGWVLHYEQCDRLFFAHGRLRLILFDGRKDSPSFGSINTFEGGELNRILIKIPEAVYHAVQNIGTTEAFYYNLPTKAYCHENPDKHRLPLDNDIIPYKFKNPRGG
ncbi:MAG TPA: hypothetical protein VNX18_17100 [Bryobacteraceae bacterium]|nr:hypothetical protein [Bryobacteraceae bacterium]